MTARSRVGLAAALAACIAGCAAPATDVVPTALVSPLDRKTVQADRARDAAAIGRSKAAVLAALGETLVISFDTGYEVWVYRLAGEKPTRSRSEAGGEFVILFAPSGLVAKTRIRAAPLPTS